MDNLTDLTHVQYVHASFQALEVFHEGPERDAILASDADDPHLHRESGCS